MTTIYITKYVVSTGEIIRSDATIEDGWASTSNTWVYFKMDRDAFTDLDEAKRNAEVRRKKMIASLELRVERLRSAQFGVKDKGAAQ
ncbi:hypothetical protein GPA19_05215 [Azoarcus indigens]|uniref:Uncharacterized protein n=1 Tax=Azoarcus indigens TaxID=29545 RepID=A0A4R6DWN5_9RHOO|nr:hypothetical protein [Azoarcus indigens]NMG64344.1 hypothetical protein [Azoarcus indigens]TDN49204.1 hypothetical protein C7389_11255 [Azoarcus indigens]